MKIKNFIILLLAFNFLDFGNLAFCSENNSISFKTVSQGKKRTLNLEGPWFFFWDTWLKPESVKEAFINQDRIKTSIPFYWTSIKNRKPLERNITSVGIASLITKITDFPENKSLALKIGKIKSNYRAYIINTKGKVIKTFSRGEISKNKIQSIPYEGSDLISLPKIKGKSFFILIHFSNYHHFSGGIEEIPSIGLENDLKKSQNLTNFKSIFLLSILLLLSIYFLILSLTKKNVALQASFSAFCFFLFIHYFLRENIISLFFSEQTNFTYDVKSKLQYSSLVLSFICIYSFFKNLFFYIFRKKEYYVILFFLALYFLLALITPSVFHTEPIFLTTFKALNIIFLLTLFLLIIKISKFKTTFSKVSILSITLLILTLINDSFLIIFSFLISVLSIISIRTSLKEKMLENYKEEISKGKEHTDMIFSILKDPKDFVLLIEDCKSNFNLKENYEDIIDLAFFAQIISKIRVGLEKFKCFPLIKYFRELEVLTKRYEDQVFSWSEMPRELKKSLIMCQDALNEFIKKNEIIENQIDSNEKLRFTNQLLEKALHDKATFFSKMSHELRTPLNSILGFSNILLNSHIEEDNIINDQSKIEYLNCINSSGRSLLGLINEVHDLTKLDLNRLKIVLTTIPLFQLLNNISTFFVNECTKKGLSFYFDLSESVPSHIIFDDLRLKQILNNLLGNSLEFTNHGHLKLSIWSKKRSDNSDNINLYFTIEDTRMENKENGDDKPLESFQQNRGETFDEGKGGGLNLHMSRKLINQMGGRIDVKNIDGVGISYEVLFKNIEPVSLLTEESKGDEENHYNFFKKTILIADDLEINLKLLNAYLSNSNVNIVTAKDGQELIDKSVASTPSLIITDIKMPTMDGYLAAKKLGSIQETKDIPIIALSAAIEKEEAKGNFIGFLQKPIKKVELLKEMSKHLECEITNKRSGDKEVFSPTKSIQGNQASFTLMNDLSSIKAHKETLIKLRFFFQRAIEIMDIEVLERGSLSFLKELEETELSHLKPWFLELNQETKLFKIKEIETRLTHAIEIIDKTLEKL
ncbi:MAG: hypothetical protein CME68_02710 [Halobacteriovoraceae bacterium]|nr:hypothetical protein [Halobacteriovoraceae bacterium]